MNITTICKGFLFLVLLINISSCKKKEDLDLIVSPGELFMNEGETRTFSITLNPKGTTDWSISSKPEWVTISPMSGRICEDIVTLTVTTNGEGLSAGKVSDYISIITTDVEDFNIEITVCVDAIPELSIDQETLIITEDVNFVQFELQNSGTGFLNYDLETNEAFVSSPLTSGYLDQDETEDVIILSDRAGLAPGNYDFILSITANTETEEYSIPGILEVGSYAELTSIQDTLHFNIVEDEKELIVTNFGNISSSFSVSSSESYLSFDYTSNDLEFEETSSISVLLDRSSFSSGDYETTISIEDDQGNITQTPVLIEHLSSSYLEIDGEIKDADYNRLTDRTIAVTSAPSQLIKINPISEEFQTMILNYSPRCVAVNPQGTHAAVGHDGNITIVNLSSLIVESIYPVSCDVGDIIFGGNNWVYSFPLDGNEAHCIDLTDNGQEHFSTGGSINDGCKAALTPDGNSIYIATNGTSPSDFEKMDISQGVADLLYDSPYHGDFAFSGDVWVNNSGEKLFARSGNSFFTSDIQSEDMIYSGAIIEDVSVLHFYENTSSDIVTLCKTNGSWLSTGASNEIQFYNTEFYTLNNTITVPDFIGENFQGNLLVMPSQVHYSFMTNNSEKGIALVELSGTSIETYNWGLYFFDAP